MVSQHSRNIEQHWATHGGVNGAVVVGHFEKVCGGLLEVDVKWSSTRYVSAVQGTLIATEFTWLARDVVDA